MTLKDSHWGHQLRVKKKGVPDPCTQVPLGPQEAPEMVCSANVHDWIFIIPNELFSHESVNVTGWMQNYNVMSGQRWTRKMLYVLIQQYDFVFWQCKQEYLWFDMICMIKPLALHHSCYDMWFPKKGNPFSSASKSKITNNVNTRLNWRWFEHSTQKQCHCYYKIMLQNLTNHKSPSFHENKWKMKKKKKRKREWNGEKQFPKVWFENVVME